LTAVFSYRYNRRWIHLLHGGKVVLRLLAIAASVTLAVGFAAREARAQYSAISSPLNTAGHSYFENIGVNWGFSGRNFFFNNGGGGALPPFGGHDPSADANFGFAGRGFFFNLTAGQGSSTTMTSQTPTIVVPNGYPGFLFDGQQRPFVTGIVPVVGSAWAMAPETATPYIVRPLEERLSRLRAEQALQQQNVKDAANEAPKLPVSSSPPKDDPPLILGK
jgi:hypothetical protein